MTDEYSMQDIATVPNAAAADPATFEIVKNGLYKIAEEMRVVLPRTRRC